MSSCKITIPLTPKPKASVRGSGNVYYNPSAKGMGLTRTLVQKSLAEQYPNHEPFKNPLLVIVHFRLPAPLALPERKRRPQNSLPHKKRPDGDNLEKFLNDALNGLLWQDDCKIAWLFRSKSITSAKVGETVLFVRELEDKEPDYELILNDIYEHIYLEESHASIERKDAANV